MTLILHYNIDRHSNENKLKTKYKRGTSFYIYNTCTAVCCLLFHSKRFATHTQTHTQQRAHGVIYSRVYLKFTFAIRTTQSQTTR